MVLISWRQIVVRLGSSNLALEKEFINEHRPLLCMRKNQLSTEPWQEAPRGTGIRWISPLGMLRKVPSNKATQGSGGGRGSSRALQRHVRQTALSRTRSAKEGSLLRTRPRSSGWRSGQGEDRVPIIMQEYCTNNKKWPRIQSFSQVNSKQ